jgi:hypothetical protein
LLTVIAAPVALAVETLLRIFVLPGEIDDARWFFGPALTVVAWALAAVTLAFGVAGIALQQRLAARSVRKLPAGRRTPDLERRARLGAFLLAASIPQIPSIAATIAYTFGASIEPVIVCIGITTVAIVVQAVRAR